MSLRGLRSRIGVRLVAAALTIPAAALMSACAPDSSGPSQELHAVDPASVDGTAMVETATAAAARELGKPVKLDPQQFTSEQGWTYLHATVQQPDGSRIDLSDTPLAEAAANGGASHRFDGLFQADGANWKLIESGVGATSPVWEDWRKTHTSVPVEIFR